MGLVLALIIEVGSLPYKGAIESESSLPGDSLALRCGGTINDF